MNINKSIVMDANNKNINISLHDRILGCLVGCGLGDALGLPSEFTGKLDQHMIITDSQKCKIKHASIGQLSDNTEMMLIVCYILIEFGEYNRRCAIWKYMEWANHHGTELVKKNTKVLFCGHKTIQDCDSKLDENKLRLKSQSNVAMSRCAILALLDDIPEALIDCELTNTHIICKKTNEIFLKIIKMVINGETRRNIAKWLVKTPSPTVIEEAIKDALYKRTRNVVKLKGWCVHSLYCAIYSLMHFRTYTTAINWVIKLGGDTSANAAISGALLGMYHGYSGLMKSEKENIQILFSCNTSVGGYPRQNQWTMNVVYNYAIMLADIFG